MSELINNREKRKEVLKDIIKQLHEGATVEEVKAKFEETFNGVSATEISEAEQALILEVYLLMRYKDFVMFTLRYLKDPLKKFIDLKMKQKYRDILPMF